MCDENDYELKAFWSNPDIQQTPQYQMLSDVIVEVDWRGTKLELLRRIQKVGKSQKFTCRETTLFKKLMTTKVKGKTPSLKDVRGYFPGKTMESLEAHYEELFF